jgi:hypothetical protein
MTVSNVTVGENYFELQGTEGVLKLSLATEVLSLNGKEVDVPESEAGGWRVEEEFIGAIRGTEKITHTAFVDGVKYMQFTEAVRSSWQRGAAVPVPLTRAAL